MTADAKNPEVPTSIAAVSDPPLNRVVRCTLKRLIILNSIILIVCSVAFFVRIYTNVVRVRKMREHDKRSYFAFQIIIMAMGIINAVIGLTLAIYERRKHRDHQLSCKLINFIHLILNILCATLFSLFFVIELTRWCSALLNNDQTRNDVRLLVTLFALVIGLCQTACTIRNRVLAWSPKYRYSRFVLCFSSTILIAISIPSIIFNARVRHLQQNVKPSDSVPLSYYTTFQTSSGYTLVCGVVGVGLFFVYGRKGYRPSQFRKRLRYFFCIICAIGLILVVVFTINLLSYRKVFDKTKMPNVYALTHSNLLLSIVQCILLLLSMRSVHSLASATWLGRNGLTVERIQLSQTPSVYLTHWSAAIDAFNYLPEGMTGDAAIQLMRAYENGQLENTECVVLRINRLSQRVPVADNQWDDTEALVLLTIIHNYDAISATHFDGFWGTLLQRTLGSKNCTKHFRPLLIRLGLIGYQWPFRTSIFFTTAHRDPLTRATHVLETIIDWNEMQKSDIHCDVLLLPTLSTELIAKAIPAAGFFSLRLPPTHLLDLRPHRGKTWNEYMKTLKKGNRRPYIQQFLTKGGTIEEIHDLSPRDVGETVCQQWMNIARIRRENKEPPTLVKPSAEFISSMGDIMSEPYRSVVFLRFNNEVIASSVIYKFPHKLITTDIQGLTHEKARPVKAYFVMLQWVIKEALDKKYDFVDFGPTTPNPKIDLGCASVPLEVGGYAGNPILAFGIQQAGSTVDTVHRKKDNQGDKKQDESPLDTQLSTSNSNAPHQIPSNTVLSQNSPEKQGTIENTSSTHISEASSVTIDNETRSTTFPVTEINLPKNKGQSTSNGGNSSGQHPHRKKQNLSKNKQFIEETKQSQSIYESQSLEAIKSLDIVPGSNDSIVKETSQIQQNIDKPIATDIAVLMFP